MRGAGLAALTALAVVAGACAPDGGDTGAASGSAEAGTSAPDSAQLIADRLMESMGGDEAWEAARFLRFRWIAERGGRTVASRSHAWDRWEGDYRLEFERDGERVLALFDVQTFRSDTAAPQGRVWVDGRPLEGAAADSALEGAYHAFINDTYWLLMPLKWEDPGVHLAYEGTRELPDGRRYQVVHLTFDPGLGVTEDRYWGFVDPETGRMAAWQFHLEGQEEKGPIIWWTDWRRVGGVWLAADRRSTEGGFRIHFEDLAASREVPPGIFDAPSP